MIQGDTIQLITSVELVNDSTSDSDEPTFEATGGGDNTTITHVYSDANAEVVWSIETSLETQVSGTLSFPISITLQGNDNFSSNPNYISFETVEVLLNIIPSDTAPASASAVQISAGPSHSLALLSDGTVRAWGENSLGILGDGQDVDRYVPVDPGLFGVVQVAASGSLDSPDFSLALLNDSTVAAWGSNFHGELGDGTTVDHRTPEPVPGLSGVSALAATASTSLAHMSDGSLMAWGSNSFGQVGDGTVGGNALVPQPVPGMDNVTQTAGGLSHFVALRSDGTVWTWGNNQRQQLGHTLTVPGVGTPGQVPGLANVQGIGAIFATSYAILADGTMMAWGAGSFGELGDGMTTVETGTPVVVSGLAAVTTLGPSGNGRHFMAGLADGTAWSWGDNEFGQIGDGHHNHAHVTGQRAFGGCSGHIAGR